ncbi:unnamed protein product, partial [Heterosigma akashiwo]
LLKTCFCYQTGDTILTVIRSQHAGRTIPWTELRIKEMPVFGSAKDVADFSVPLYEGLFDPSSDMKISLAFSDQRHTIPWTQIYDATKEQQLEQLTVTFYYSDSTINQIKWDTK